MSRADDRARGLARAFLARPADPGAAAPARTAGWTCWPAPGSTRWRCACRRIRSRWRCCARWAGRWRRPRPTAPARSARPRRRMCWRGSAAASPRCWMAAPAPVGVESTVLDLTGARRRAAAPRRRAGGGDRGGDRPGRPRAADRRGRGDAEACARRGCCCRITRPACRCGSTRRRSAADEALLAFGRPLPGARRDVEPVRRGDLTEAASRLFAGLRWLDAEGARARPRAASRRCRCRRPASAPRSTTGWRGPQRREITNPAIK